MGAQSGWLNKYWAILLIVMWTVIIAAVSIAYFYWVFTRPLPLPPYP
jgi:hypothetical protein